MSTHELSNRDWADALGVAFRAARTARFEDESPDPGAIGMLAGQMHAEAIVDAEELLDTRAILVAGIQVIQDAGRTALAAEGAAILQQIDAELLVLEARLGGTV